MIIRVAALLMALAITTPAAHAATPGEALGQCLTLKSTGADRVALMQWIFTTMAQHPAIGALAPVTAAQRQDIDRQMATVVERLITVDCLSESKALSAGTNASEGLKQAFAQLGTIAMSEVFSNTQVDAASTAFATYMDGDKVRAALGQ